MPKKHTKSSFVKPAHTVHPSLISSHSKHGNDPASGSTSSASATEHRSVNDLINHLRHTQVSKSSTDDSHATSSRFTASVRSVHPSLRNILELPETPAPRPRPNARRTEVGHRARRIAGPPPPDSWLVDGAGIDRSPDPLSSVDGNDDHLRRVIHRLERLPGPAFPPKHSLLHMGLKSLARNWPWHVAYDGPFLSQLPSQVKVLLLSYLATFYYARDPASGTREEKAAAVMGDSRRVLRTLFGAINSRVDDDDSQAAAADGEVCRLDLGAAIGKSMSLKQLVSELRVFRRPEAFPDMLPSSSDAAVPESWDAAEEEAAVVVDADFTHPLPLTIASSIPHGLLFENLHFLSLAHPHPAAASWNSLLGLLSRLSTLTHLSLAHWPMPTLTPNSMHARVRHPAQRSLIFSYSGTDAYAAFDNNWAEASAILRRLSRATYCLKWLDLEGCSPWIPALVWQESAPDGSLHSSPAGPEWNGSWRDIEAVRLGPGWSPCAEEAEEDENATKMASGLTSHGQNLSSSSLRALHLSAHAVPESESGDGLPWNVEAERRRYRRAKELERHQRMMSCARTVADRVLQIRREARGKWIHFSLSTEED